MIIALKLEIATASKLPGNSPPSSSRSGISRYSISIDSGVIPASVNSPRLGSEAITFDRSTNPGSVSPISINSWLWQRTPLIAINPSLTMTSRSR